MTGRQRLADVARSEAIKGFHGYAMGTAPNFEPIVSLFPPWPLEAWNGRWCAAFVYYCCRLAGYDLPVRHPDPEITCSFAGCAGWAQWAKRFGYFLEPVEGTGEKKRGEAGDIVLFEYVFDGSAPDHIGIVLAAEDSVLTVAEGSFSNVSAVVSRSRTHHVHGFIRMPEHPA